MLTPSTPVRLLVGASVLTLAALTACSDSNGPIPEDELETEIANQLETSTASRPDDVDCPGDLESEEGATMRCTLTASDGSQIEGTVSVAEVDGDSARWEFQVDETLSAPPDSVGDDALSP